METVKVSWLVLALALVAVPAAAQSLGAGTVVYGGNPDDGWAFTVSILPGWNFDCCNRATDLDASLLVFPANWDGDGANLDRVMVLTVWPKERADLASDWQADADDYFTHYPGLTSITYQAQVKDAACLASTYFGADGVSDHVVFCDPGADWNYRLAWSMSVRGERADTAVEDAFRETVNATTPMHMHIQASPR